VELGETPRQLELDSATVVVVENPAGAGPWWAEDARGEADDDDG
jgi:hypothetical protein